MNLEVDECIKESIKRVIKSQQAVEESNILKKQIEKDVKAMRKELDRDDGK